MAKIVSVDIVKKPNKNSSLYRVCCDNGIFILRSAPLYQRHIIELQCLIISNLATQDFIDPIASTNTKFVVESEKLGWIAYPELKGEIFDGQNCNIEFIIQEVFLFIRKLSLAARGLSEQERLMLQGPIHRPHIWHDVFGELIAFQEASESTLYHALGKTGHLLLRQYKNQFVATLEKIIDLLEKTERTLVHNDLNHSNVLVQDGKLRFLDIEDIVFENRKVALSHAIFKLFRHKIHAGSQSVSDKLRTSLFRQISVAEKFACDPMSKDEFFLFGAYRIISEICEITMFFIEKNDPSRLFDLEKKIQNFCELCDLMEIKRGLKT